MTARKRGTPKVGGPYVRKRRTMLQWFHEQTQGVQAIMKGVGAIAAFIGLLLAINSHFASAGDVNELRKSIDKNSLQTHITIQSVRKSQVLDQVEQLRIKEAAARGRLPHHEKQRLDRLVGEYGELTNDISQKQRLLDRIQYGGTK